MPFEAIEVQTKHNAPATACVSYKKPERKGASKRDARPRLLISIPTTIAGITKRKFFVLQLGKGTDVGKARISGHNAANKFSVTPRHMKHCVNFNFGYVPLLGDDAAEAEHCVVRKVSDDEFEIDLPAWFK